MEKVSLSLDVPLDEELSGTEGFKEKDAAKNAWDGVATALEFIQTGNYFYFNPFILFFETIVLIWLNPLVPGVPNLYPQYHLKFCLSLF